MKRFLSVIIVFVCFFAGPVSAEQVRVLIGDKHAEATLVAHSDGCILISVRHVFEAEGRHVQFWREGDRRSYFAEVEKLPPGAQNRNMVGWTKPISDARLQCMRSLSDARFERWSQVLRELYQKSLRSNPFESSFHVLLRGRDGLVPVSIRLWGPAEGEFFRFKIRTNDNRSFSDRASISGSGIYVEVESGDGSTEYRLVGKVDGVDQNGVYRAFRIEPMANTLGLVGRGSARTQSRSGAAGRTLGDTQRFTNRSAVIDPPVHTRCDIEAANSSDPDRFPGIDGVHGDVMSAKSKEDLEAILELCRRAAQDNPTSGRLAYQEARVLFFLHQSFAEDYPFSEVIDALNKAQAMRHNHAQVNIDELLIGEDRSCPDYQTCEMEHRLSVDLVRADDPNRARLSDFARLVESDLARNECPNFEKCRAKGLAALQAIDDPQYTATLEFNFAWMYVSQNYADHCGGQDSCRPVVAEWLRNAVDAGEPYAAYWQGVFLSRQNELTQICSTRLACQNAALAAFEIAAASNDARAWEWLGDLAYKETWRAAIGCGDYAACAAFAHEKYLAAAELNQDSGRIDAAYGYIFRQDEIGCDDADACFAQARALLEKVDDKTHPRYLRRYAELLRFGARVMSDVCEGQRCDFLAAKSYLDAHEAGDTYIQTPFRIAEFTVMDAQAFAKGNAPSETATGCDNARGCSLAALEWYETAARAGNPDFLLDNWFGLIVGPPHEVLGTDPAFTAALGNWLKLSQSVSPSDNRYAFSWFTLEALREGTLTYELCASLEGECEARASALLKMALETSDYDLLRVMSSWIGPIHYAQSPGPYSDIVRQILLRSVPTLNEFNIYDIFYSGLFSELACPIGQVDCGSADMRPIHETVALEGESYLPQLHWANSGVGWRSGSEGVTFRGYRMSNHKDVLLAAHLMATHDIPLGHYLIAVHAEFGGGEDAGWTERGLDVHRRVARTIANAIQFLPRKDACDGTVVLATMNERRRQRIISAQAERDAYVLALAYCGQDKLFANVRSRLETDSSFASSIQSIIRAVLKDRPISGKRFAVDGKFGDQSWAAVDRLHSLAIASLPDDRANNQIPESSGFEAATSIDTRVLNAAHERLVAELDGT